MEEKLRILKMVEEGTNSAEQARELLEALGEPETVQASAWNAPAVPLDVPYEDRMLRILVDSADGDKVRVQFPIKAIKAILKVTGKLPIQMSGDMEGVDIEALTDAVVQCLEAESVGDIVTVESADGDNVRIFIG